MKIIRITIYILLIIIIASLCGCAIPKRPFCSKVEYFPTGCSLFNGCCSIQNPCPTVKVPGYYPVDLDCIEQLRPLYALRQRGVGIIILGHRLRIIIPVDNFFNEDLDINECHVNTVAVIASVIKSLPCVPIFITGHVDDVGTCIERGNRSRALAQTVAAHLWAQGIDWDRMIVRGKSNCDPIADDQSVFGSTDNRRVEIRMDFSGNYRSNCRYNNSYCPDCIAPPA